MHIYAQIIMMMSELDFQMQCRIKKKRGKHELMWEISYNNNKVFIVWVSERINKQITKRVRYFNNWPDFAQQLNNDATQNLPQSLPNRYNNCFGSNLLVVL